MENTEKKSDKNNVFDMDRPGLATKKKVEASLKDMPTEEPFEIHTRSCTQIRDLFLLEVKSMTRYTMSSGMSDLPDHIYPVIEAFSVEYEEREKQKQILKELYVFNEKEALDLTKLVEVHDLLSVIIKPATPRAILLLDPVYAEKGLFAWISPVLLLRRLMIVAFLSLVGFVAISLSPYISKVGGDIFEADGLPLLVNLMFFMFSASLGACFSALFQVNNYIIDGTFDPKFEPSYWIRILVGVMAGLILASLVPLDANALNGFGKPTLSLLGGFSASLVYRVLNLLVTAVEDVVKRVAAVLSGTPQNNE